MSEPVVVGMSGGVDSTYAVIALQEQGYEPIGVSLKLPVWDSDKNVICENRCCTQESLDVAKHVCEQLGVPHHVYEAEESFKDEVIGYIIDELRDGKTPNPCTVCNRNFKFSKLLEWADQHNVNYVATGHYARVRYNEQTKKYELLKGKDETKDQSYGLAYLSQAQLSRIILPLGDGDKQEVIQTVITKGFTAYKKKKESQDFCFVGKKAYQDFLQEEIGVKEGNIVDKQGNILGQHQGVHFYTIGQKKGLRLPAKHYVIKKENDRVVVSADKKDLEKKTILLEKVSFIAGEPPALPLRVTARIRYGQPLKRATLQEGYKIVFEEPQAAVTPGQFCVFYSEDVCLGCGVIE
ncbi:tRNA 2-thiouridine(34) synthase MnmA [Candidatus Woesearchaeota archaeon]|nr:tRNA 2-thiouridine(34) synthase MnmA [Candidatus Woesearchaeota archaeon]